MVAGKGRRAPRTPLRWTELEEHLRREPPGGAYALCGPEMLLADDAQEAIARRVLSGEWARMNTDTFRAPESGPGRVIQAAQQSPLFAERRLVVYSQWDLAARSAEREKQAWLKYLDAPSPSTCLIARSQLASRELVRKGKYFAESLTRMVVVDLWHPFPAEAVAWVRRRGEALGLRVADSVARFLVDHVGNDLLSLRHELEKLSLLLAAGPDAPRDLNPDVLEELKGRGLQASTWDCVRALVEGDTLKAIQYLPAAREEDRPTSLVWKIQYQANRRAQEGRGDWGTRLLRDCYHWERDLKRGRWPGSQESVALEILFMRAHHRRERRSDQVTGARGAGRLGLRRR